MQSIDRRAALPFRATPQNGLVLSALNSASRRARAVGSNAWHVRLTSRLAVRASLSGDWLVLETEPARRVQNRWKREDGPVELLRLQRTLPGNVKFVLDEGTRPLRNALRLRAEIPLPDTAASSESEFPDSFHVQVNRSLDSIIAAFSLEASVLPSPAASVSGTGPVLEAVTTTCVEAGWPVAGTAESLRITLDTEAQSFRQAVATVEPHHIRLLLNLYDDLPEEPPPVSRRATAMLLLRTGSSVRLIRPLISEPAEEIGYEVRLSREPAAADVLHALSALSVAARHSALEAEALADARVASAYLASLECDAANHVRTTNTSLTREASWATE